jgi:tRNA-specific 2-thiouridylase
LNKTQAIKGKKVFIATSGGVDSSVAASLLVEAGCDCTGIFMLVHDAAEQHRSDAANIAKQLGIKFETLDLRNDFKAVLDSSCGEYEKARTPNPCVFCNRNIKFGKLFEYAGSKGADFFATGHYAAIHNNGLYAAVSEKDQSYALAMIARDVLPYLIFPLGDFCDKEQTRRIAKELGLSVENKPDSQEICFIPDNNYAAKLQELRPTISHRGNIIDSSGKIIGEHNGIHNFTIGQRRGVRVAMGVPWYVTKLDAVSNTVCLGPAEELSHKTLSASNPNWLIDIPQEPFAAKIKIRYNHKPVNGMVYPEQNSVKIIFEQPLRAITPGQTAVFYIDSPQGRQVAGGAWIDEAAE